MKLPNEISANPKRMGWFLEDKLWGSIIGRECVRRK